MTEKIHERQERENQDIETLAALEDAGSNLTKVHYLEHYFFSRYNRDCRENCRGTTCKRL
ncbi:hypothetical protein ACT7DG_26415 [Bacillus cereus]